MANVFDATNERNNEIYRSPFDWSHQNSLTARFGLAYPCFCELAPQNTTLKIKPNLGLQFMPMVFPVQTRMKARVSFFKVPLRTLWKDYKDYIGNFREGLVEPYLDFASSFDSMIGPCKLGDYLDIPCVSYGNYGSYLEGTTFEDPTRLSVCHFTIENENHLSVGAEWNTGVPTEDNSRASYFVFDTASTVEGTMDTTLYFNSLLSNLPSEFVLASGAPVLDGVNKIYVVGNDSKIRFVGQIGTFTSRVENGVTRIIPTYDSSLGITIPPDVSLAGINLHIVFAFDERSAPTATTSFALCNGATYQPVDGEYKIVLSVEGYQSNYTVLTPSTSPYYSSTDNPDGLRLKAYKPRAYEAVYNAYLRDNRNNPYYVNGVVQYNNWIPTDEGGADKTPYALRRVNWEKDFLTTAVPSPQQGKAPLVGLTSYQSTDASGATSLRYALVDEDGKRYAVNFKSSADGLESVEYSELGDKLLQAAPSFRSLVDLASTGISIPDLRIVNAYQKFLELNMRKGYSYKEIIEGRFDCQVRYDDLNIPEFLGGYTRDINMNRVVQSVERGDGTGLYADALGSLAGDAFLSESNPPEISCFCDEEAIVIGIFSVVPMANYSQLLPKDYLYEDLLDHFQPEFNALGFQPITYKEVAPIQAHLAGRNLDSVFGYQRPWYEHVAKVDRVHGLFRTQLRNFLINRVFDKEPALTESFLLVDDSQVNDVFAVTETTDKILVQFWFDCTCVNPVARVAIPRLD